jgi:hypothetical protein
MGAFSAPLVIHFKIIKTGLRSFPIMEYSGVQWSFFAGVILSLFVLESGMAYIH